MNRDPHSNWIASLKTRLSRSSPPNTQAAWERIQIQLPGAVPPPVRIRWMWRTTMVAMSGAVAATLALVVLTKGNRLEISPPLSSNTVETRPVLTEDPELLENLELMLHLEDLNATDTESDSTHQKSLPHESPGDPGAAFFFGRFYHV